MSLEINLEQWRSELVDAFHWREQEKARTLVATLREVARRMAAAPETVRVIKAATLLEYVGQREDAELLAAHKPQDEVLGRVYEEAIEALRKLPHP